MIIDDNAQLEKKKDAFFLSSSARNQLNNFESALQKQMRLKEPEQVTFRELLAMKLDNDLEALRESIIKRHGGEMSDKR